MAREARFITDFDRQISLGSVIQEEFFSAPGVDSGA
jgi:hypothetical protein